MAMMSCIHGLTNIHAVNPHTLKQTRDEMLRSKDFVLLIPKCCSDENQKPMDPRSKIRLNAVTATHVVFCIPNSLKIGTSVSE